MHLAERHTHLLENVFFLDAGTDQVGLDAFHEFFEFKSGHIVIQQGGIAHFLDGAVVVVVVAELVAGADHFHAQILVGTDDVARTQTADIQHDPLALQTRFVFVDDGLHHRLVLGDDAFRTFLDMVVEVRGDGAQRLGHLGRAEEVVFQPGNAVLFFHVARDVVHRTIAVDQVQLGVGRHFHFGDGAVTGPLRDHAQAHFFQQDAG